MSDKTKEIVFNCDMLGGNVTINREQLVANLKQESRSYANHDFTIGNSKKFNLKELSSQFPSGVQIGVVIKIKDNLGKQGSTELTEI